MPSWDRMLFVAACAVGVFLYGAAVGILMLEARFPRIPGDVGNAATWPFPVLYKVVRGASPERVVRRKAEGLLEAFIEGARELVAEGADGIVTNCGFLSLIQDELAAACFENAESRHAKTGIDAEDSAGGDGGHPGHGRDARVTRLR